MKQTDSIQPVKILVVDDLQEKLLVYQTILEEPGQELVLAHSGQQALKQVLAHDFAVILLDVNMPDMDGFETASLIRGRKRCAHTPIIFITAYADELHAMKGYSHGAVDYILAPVVPDIVRTKVRVFVELFRKNLEIQRQSEILRDLEAKEHRRQLSETHQRLEFALEAGRMGAWEWDLGSQLMSWSSTLEEIFGLEAGAFSGSAEELRARLHPEDRDDVITTMLDAAENDREFRVEHRIIRPDGEIAWVEVRGRVQQDGRAARRLTGVCMDISERKRTEAHLSVYRENLEDLVRERTVELNASYERLRVADRLASIGTLAAGLGHDMGNLLLPVQIRLQSLERMNLESEARADVLAIKTACEYLKRLSQGLRLFALDPEESSGQNDHTRLHRWWLEVEPFLRNAVPKAVTVRTELPPAEELPEIAMPSHRFNQMIYNLVQNAGDAMRDRGAGEIVISAQYDAEAQHIVLTVSDDGPGMTEDVRQRCMEPFFTTKTRGISTGLGLALVHGAVAKAGGSVEIRTQLGQGTQFRLTLPVVQTIASTDDSGTASYVAHVALRDARVGAYVTSILHSMGVQVNTGEWSAHTAAHVLVVDAAATRADDVMAFARGDADRRVVLLGQECAIEPDGRVHVLERKPTPTAMRQVLHETIRRRQVLVGAVP